MADVKTEIVDWRSGRCGHNFEAKECVAAECGYRDALLVIAQLTNKLATTKHEVQVLVTAGITATKRAEKAEAATNDIDSHARSKPDAPGQEGR